MARVRINKMTVAELAAYCKEQRQGGSCPQDCALRKLGCSKFLPALWDIEAVRREEQREDAIDMVRHLIAAHGIYPEDIFPELPEVEPPQDKRVPNWLKDAIGKESEDDGSGGAVTSSPEDDAAPVLTVGLAESECVWADETESEAATAAETAAAEPTKAPALETERNIADVQAAARAAGMSYGRYVSMQETAARLRGDTAKSEREAEEILTAGKKKPSRLDGFKPIAECKPVEPPKRRGRPPRKASE